MCPASLLPYEEGKSSSEEAVVIPLQEQARLMREFGLTRRQGEVMALLIQGKTYKAIGGVLGVSENTVRSHVKKLYDKAGVTSRMELLHLFLTSSKTT